MMNLRCQGTYALVPSSSIITGFSVIYRSLYKHLITSHGLDNSLLLDDDVDSNQMIG